MYYLRHEISGEQVALTQIFLRVLMFYPVSIIPLLLHTYLHLNAPPSGQAGENYAFSEIGESWAEMYSTVMLQRGMRDPVRTHALTHTAATLQHCLPLLYFTCRRYYCGQHCSCSTRRWAF